jgi:hypothetical protein
MKLVSEMPYACGQHYYTILVTAVDRILISHTTSGLGNYTNFGLARILDCIIPSCKCKLGTQVK